MQINDPEQNAWHTLDASAVLKKLDTDASKGLTPEEAKQRQQHWGLNTLKQGHQRSAWRILWSQFADFMILILLAAAVIAGVVGEVADSLAIAAILLLNAVIGFTQEMRAEHALAALQQMAAPNTQARRNGKPCCVPSSELVPGDIVMLDAGVQVPADLRLLEASTLQIDEAALTGESVPVTKNSTLMCAGDASIGDRLNMAWKGTLISNGRGLGVVVSTGMHTELGRIASMLDSATNTPTPLQKRLASFSKRLGLGVLAICAIIFATGLARGEPPLLMLLTAISLAVAAIPEALPAVVTIALALGAYRLVGQQALIRRLSSVETLGSVTWVCSDKTGTLTENHMHMESLLLANGQLAAEQFTSAEASVALTAMVLCNDAEFTGTETKGDPTEVALLEAAHIAGINKAQLESAQPRIDELPFDSNRMRMTTFHQDADGIIAFTKGAPEAVISRCNSWYGADQQWNPEIVARQAAALAADGMRVLAVARRRWDAVPARQIDAETALELLGFVGLMDPPRPEATAAIATCRTAGITPVMITGDHPATALNIARRLQLAEGEDSVMTGKELATLSDSALLECVRNIRVFARVDPAQKIRIVLALQSLGEFVAMTGDGVNDAPALKQADIGVAMGKVGTDVAREAADMILLDDNFSTIVAAISSGRRIFDNIRRFIRYVLTTNSAEVLVIFVAPLLGLPLPLLPLHILWVNLVTDGLPGLALTAEPAEPALMSRPPRPPNETLLAGGMWQHVLLVGLLMSVLVLGVQAYALDSGKDNWQTLVFTTLTFTQLAHVMAIRSERESLFSIGLFSNPLLLAAVVITIGLQLLLIYVPFFNEVFATAPMTLAELSLCGACALVILVVVELEKWLKRLGILYRQR